MHTKIPHFFRPFTAVFTAAVFLCTSSAAVALPTVEAAATPSVVAHLDIPRELATVDQSYRSRAENRPLVIHIQNAHSSSEAQFQIDALIGYLSEKHGIRTALVEGAVGLLDGRFLRYFSDPKLNRAVNEYLVKKGLLSGVQLSLLNGKNGLRIFGVEEVDLYRKDLTAFREVMQEDSTIQRFLAQGEAALTGLEQKIFDRDLHELVTKRKAYHDRRLALLPYVTFLKSQARAHLQMDLSSPSAQRDWPALVRLFILQNVEEMDQATFETEFERLDSRLSRSAGSESIREKLRELKARSVGKGRSILPGAETRALVEEMYASGGDAALPREEFPQVTHWLTREMLSSEIDGAELVEEMERLTDRLLERLADEEVEKDLLLLSDDTDLLGNALKLELSGRDFKRFTQRESELAWEKFTARLKTFQDKAGVPTSGAPRFDFSGEKMNRLLASAKRFYVYARLRDETMAGHIEQIIQKENVPAVILVTGGFHTEGILSDLRKKDYSYITLTPHLKGSMEMDRTAYVAQLMNAHPNLFARAHLEPAIPEAVDRSAVIAMLPGGERDLDYMAEIRAGGIIDALGQLKVPAQMLTTFTPNDFVNVTVNVTERFATVSGFGTEVKIPVQAGLLDTSRMDVRKISASSPSPNGLASKPSVQKPVSDASSEEALRAVFSRLTQPDVLRRIPESNLREVQNAVARVSSTADADREVSLVALPSAVARLSSGPAGTFPISDLAGRVTPDVLWKVLTETGFEKALNAFLVPVASESALPSVEIAASETPELTPDLASVAPVETPETPLNLTVLTTDQLTQHVFSEFPKQPADATTPDAAVRIVNLVASSVGRGIYGNPFAVELASRTSPAPIRESSFAPASMEKPKPAVSARPSYTKGMTETTLSALARSGGVVAAFDLTTGTPNNEEIEAYLSQLNESAASKLKVIFLAKTRSGEGATFGAQVKQIADRLGIAQARYHVVLAAGDREFAKQITTIHNRVASYVTEAERKQHVAFVVSKSLESAFAAGIPEGASVIIHDIDRNTPHYRANLYWTGTAAVLFALLKDELNDPAVRAMLSPVKVGERPGFYTFASKLALSLGAEIARMEQILASA